MSRHDEISQETCMIDVQRLRQDLPLDNGRHHVKITADIGLLSKLPLELMYAVLLQLDLGTLTVWRRVNGNARRPLDSIHEYKFIVSHGLDTLRASLAVGAARQITCQTMFTTMITSRCETCQDYGCYIYLPTCSRACWICLVTRFKYLPLEHSSVKSHSRCFTHYKHIPELMSLPGTYSPALRRSPNRLVLHDRTILRRLAGALSHSDGGWLASDEDHNTDRWTRVGAPQIYHVRRQRHVSSAYNLSYKSDATQRALHRYMLVVYSPSLDAATGNEISGYRCIGCRDQYGQVYNCTRRYTQDTIPAHLLECEHHTEQERKHVLDGAD